MRSPRTTRAAILATTLFLTLPLLAASARAEVDIGVSVGVALPPPIVFPVAPQLVVLPGTYVYAVPDYADEVFYVDGWWWRPWQGRWYRSHSYDRDWGVYSGVPYFYQTIPRDWRTDYRSHRWRGRPWNYDHVSYGDAERNWSSWKQERRWSSDRQKAHQKRMHRDSKEDSKRVHRDSKEDSKRLHRRSKEDSKRIHRDSKERSRRLHEYSKERSRQKHEASKAKTSRKHGHGKSHGRSKR